DTHWTLFSQPSQESLISQGITTILGGNCGSSLAPLIKPENIEGIERWVDISKININWQTMKEFLAELSGRKIGVNFASLAGHNTLRAGAVENVSKSATEKEIEKINFLFKNAVKEGAFGISFSLGTIHGQAAGDEEIIALHRLAGEYGVLVKHHLEDEGKNILPGLSRLAFFLHSLPKSRRPRVQISHFKALGRAAWSLFPNALEMIEKLIKENYSLSVDFFPFLRTGSNLLMVLPGWARETGARQFLEELKNPEKRKNLINGLKDLTLHYDKIIVASTLRDTGSVGKTISKLAENAGISPEEIILDLLKINNLQVVIFNEAISENNLFEITKKDYSMVASDGVGSDFSVRQKNNLPHPRSFGSFPKFLELFVREKQILSWEQAVYKMTGQPAQSLGLKDRGTIKPGAYADLVVFNPETVGSSSSYQNPWVMSQGIDCVLINGEIVLEAGKLTGEKAGKVLRKS
ncbi:MAG: amidohydrolase family protein, partial [Patescibacteria group bacterium]